MRVATLRVQLASGLSGLTKEATEAALKLAEDELASAVDPLTANPNPPVEATGGLGMEYASHLGMRNTQVCGDTYTADASIVPAELTAESYRAAYARNHQRICPAAAVVFGLPVEPMPDVASGGQVHDRLKEYAAGMAFSTPLVICRVSDESEIRIHEYPSERAALHDFRSGTFGSADTETPLGPGARLANDIGWQMTGTYGHWIITIDKNSTLALEATAKLDDVAAEAALLDVMGRLESQPSFMESLVS
jgi:hypothetical protein